MSNQIEDGKLLQKSDLAQEDLAELKVIVVCLFSDGTEPCRAADHHWTGRDLIPQHPHPAHPPGEDEGPQAQEDVQHLLRAGQGGGGE